jgi:hypothetical protein
MIAAPDGPLAPSTTSHCRLSEDALRGGCRRTVLVEAFAQWSRPTDIAGAWGHYGLNLMAAAGGAVSERLDLRALAQRLANRKLGGLEDHAVSFGPVTEPLADGRAGVRLAALVQIIDRWRTALSP